MNEFSGQLLGLNLIPLLAGCSTHGNLGELLNFLLGLWPGLNEIVRVTVSTVSAAATCVRVKSLQSCPALCNRMDCSSPGSFVHGFLQTRILEWVAMPSSRGSSQPRDRTFVSCVSCIGRWVLVPNWGRSMSRLYIVTLLI